MRAGCFAETRVIHLLNRRFIPFYYNTDNGTPTKDVGKDPAAKAFTAGKTKNRWAFFAAFTSTGDPVGVTDVYANKDVTFDFLVALLRENPEYDRYTPQEEAILARAKATPTDPSARIEAGRLLEELGRYPEAREHYEEAIHSGKTSSAAAEGHRALLRLARYSRDWGALAKRAQHIQELGEEQIHAMNLGPDLAMETAYALLEAKKYFEARPLLEAAITKFPQSKRQSEFHFHAGVTYFFLKDRDQASYHWCYVVENLPDDRLARRCYTAAAHEGMPYANPELGGYRAPLPGGNIQVIQAAYERAKKSYDHVQAKGTRR